MTPEVARRMNRLNEGFYRDNARSFGQTRQAAWLGWKRCLGYATRTLPQDCGARILDIASGNLRLAHYLAKTLSDVRVSYHGVDNCPELAKGVRLPEGWDVTLQPLDVVGALLDGDLKTRLGESGADLVSCFGFFHHVPTAEARRRLLQELLSHTRTGGLCCVSLWRLMCDKRIARRALESTRAGLWALGLGEGELDENDYLLGWQGRTDTWRYCHHFDEGEVDELVQAAQGTAELTARFQADGKTGNLNSYLVLTKG